LIGSLLFSACGGFPSRKAECYCNDHRTSKYDATSHPIAASRPESKETDGADRENEENGPNRYAHRFAIQLFLQPHNLSI